MHNFKKNEIRPHQSKYWKIPPKENAQFVAKMEDILEVYQRPYDPRFPVVCMDESNKQLLAEVQKSLPMKKGQVLRMDDEYIRKGVGEIFIEVEPLAGKRYVKITERRTKKDWGIFISEMLNFRYPDAEKVILVMDNLNTHCISSLYEVFPAAEAFRLAQRLEIHYTPKHGSWLNIAEIELSVLKRQCFPERISSLEELNNRTRVWYTERNSQVHRVNWQYTTIDSRIGLKHLYPKLEKC